MERRGTTRNIAHSNHHWAGDFQSRHFLNDRRRFAQLVDPSLQGRYPQRAFHQLIIVTTMCLQEQPHVRPIIRDVVVALNHVASQPYIPDPEYEATRSSPPSSSSSSPSLQLAGAHTVRCNGRKGRRSTLGNQAIG